MSSNIIGLSNHSKRSRFINPLSITADIPSNSDLPRNRNIVHLAMPYIAQNQYKNGKLSREQYENIYRKALENNIPDLQEFLDKIIETYGENPVFLGLHNDPSICYRSILMKIINEETTYEAREVQEQWDLHGIDLSEFLG